MSGNGYAGEFSAGCEEEAGSCCREGRSYAWTGAKVGEGDGVGFVVVVV